MPAMLSRSFANEFRIQKSFGISCFFHHFHQHDFLMDYLHQLLIYWPFTINRSHYWIIFFLIPTHSHQIIIRNQMAFDFDSLLLEWIDRHMTIFIEGIHWSAICNCLICALQFTALDWTASELTKVDRLTEIEIPQIFRSACRQPTNCYPSLNVLNVTSTHCMCALCKYVDRVRSSVAKEAATSNAIGRIAAVLFRCMWNVWCRAMFRALEPQWS